ncbi:MAG: efflux RND transporter periplasmic adaptor subunit [Candidatus Hydrogenedentes bacterium]|nr:efflux RND transporter periplasmic adaptor subunit [Candidatus Hydrogenedentota bacterium]
MWTDWHFHAMAAGWLLCLFTGCTNQVEGKATEPAAEKGSVSTPDAAEVVTIPVEAARPARADVSSFFETTARVQAERRVEIVPQGMGECVELHFEEGDAVNAGDVLAQLDREALDAQIRQTRVTVSQQENALKIAERALAEGIGTEVERDNARFAHEQALATLHTQEVQLSNQTLTSPITGIVTRRNIQKGMLVTSAMPAFTVVDPSSFNLPINVPERELAHLKVDQEAHVNIDSLPGETLVARVERISPSVDPMNGTVEVVLNFDESAQKLLREAAFARVRLVMETHPDALVVPKDSLLEDNTRKYLMIVEQPAEAAAANQDAAGLLAKRIEVETGLEDSNQIEITNGIDENTLVVTLGQHTLKEGSRVSVTNAEQEILSRGGVTPGQALESAKDKQMRLGHGRDRRERMMGGG